MGWLPEHVRFYKIVLFEHSLDFWAIYLAPNVNPVSMCLVLTTSPKLSPCHVMLMLLVPINSVDSLQDVAGDPGEQRENQKVTSIMHKQKYCLP